MSGGPADAGGAGARTRRLLGSCLGAGLLPIAPGTWGSAVPIAAMAALHGVEGWWGGLLPASITDSPARTAPLAWAFAFALVYVLGARLGDSAASDWDGEDPGAFVLDEVVGQGIALFPLLPLLPGPLPALPLVAAFVLFRILDVLKPPPCRRLEALPGGLGIMADDLFAGAYAALGVAALHGALRAAEL
ncbi:MAG TPA: phosphatidylglycerophosphatase A [Planctomycetota bacterium]|nr:phosphatidylglycerophosphatase A [Planctomycetota bacterium]